MAANGDVIAGIDLAVTRPSTIAVLSESGCIEVRHLKFNELISELSHARLVAVDAPLSLPNEGAFRDFERALLKRGYRLLPLSLTSMRKLANIGIELKNILENEGVVVLETHPASAKRALGLSDDDLVNIMKKLRFCKKLPRNKDEIDALVCLLVALLYVNGKTEEIKGEEGSMVLPLLGVRYEELELCCFQNTF